MMYVTQLAYTYTCRYLGLTQYNATRHYVFLEANVFIVEKIKILNYLKKDEVL
jgi:hypothetical protein